MSALRTIELAGATITIDARAHEDRRHVDWFFGPSPTSIAPPDVTVEIGAFGDLERRGAAPPTAPDHRDGAVSTWCLDDELWVEHADGGTAWGGPARLSVRTNADAGLRWRVTRQLLFASLSWWFERRSVLMVHAAAIARGDDAFLVTGPTGAGKSTTVVAASSRGWDVMSDDLALVAGDDTPRVWGVPKRPTVERGLSAASDRDSTLMPDDERARVMLGESRFAVGWRRLAGVVSVAHDDRDGSYRPVDASSTLDELMAAWPESARPDALRRQFARLVAAARVPAFELDLAADPGVRVERTGDLLECVWSERDEPRTGLRDQ